MNIILFDIDGTLLRSHGSGKRATNKTFMEFFSIAESWADIQAAGKTDPIIFDEIALKHIGRKLETKEKELIYQCYLSHFAREIENCDNYELMKGIPTLLEKVAKLENTVVGLQTGNLEEAAWIKLKHGNIDHYFSFGGFATDSAIRTELVAAGINKAIAHANITRSDINKIVVIGDTQYDILAGKDNGAYTIAVENGFYKADFFKEFKPDVIFEDFSDTDKVIEAILS